MVGTLSYIESSNKATFVDRVHRLYNKTMMFYKENGGYETLINDFVEYL